MYASHAVWARKVDGQISISSSFVLAYRGNLVSLDTEIAAEMGFAQASSDTLRVTILMSTKGADCRELSQLLMTSILQKRNVSCIGIVDTFIA